MEGYLRFNTQYGFDGNITYYISLEKNIKNGSKFVNFNNVKKKASKYAEIYKFDEVRVVDDNLMKYYYVKKITKNEEKHR